MNNEIKNFFSEIETQEYIDAVDASVEYISAVLCSMSKDTQGMYSHLCRAAEKGSVDAQMLLADQAYSGRGMSINEQEAFELCFKAALNGNRQAAENAELLSRKFYITTTALQREFIQAYRKAPGVAPGELFAQLALAQARGSKEMLFWLTRAAKCNHIPSQMELAELYFATNDPDLHKQAFTLYVKAAKAGNAAASYAVAQCLLNGKGTPRDPKAAFQFCKAAVYGREQGPMEAYALLAELYEAGIGVEKDVEAAASLREVIAYAEELDTEEGQEDLAEEYYRRAEQLRNSRPEEAYELYCDAAVFSHVPAMLKAAHCCLTGFGCEKDLTMARYYYEQAADIGDPEGIYRLAWCSENGYGTPKDKKAAKQLYKKAADMGHKEAKQRIKKGFLFM